MAAKVMRVGDTFSGTCNQHGSITGTITIGSPTTTANNLAVARVGDKGNCSCGHTFTITTGSTVVKADNIAICIAGKLAVVDNVGGTLTAQTNSGTVESD